LRREVGYGKFPQEMTAMWFGRLQITLTLAAVLTLTFSVWGAPAPEARQGWNQYIAQVERQMKREIGGRAWPDQGLSGADRVRLRNGEVLIERFQPPKLEGGLIHHWAGTAFIPGASLDQVEDITEDIADFPQYYAPAVVSARVLSASPPESRVILRLRKDYIATVVLEAEYVVHRGSVDATHAYSSSRSVRIQEVHDFGLGNEGLVPPGNDHGFLWAMNSYWSYAQSPEGVYVRCETVSLSRDIPFGMGWLIGPVVERMPRESLRFTLAATRNAVLRLADTSAPATVNSMHVNSNLTKIQSQETSR